jgi:hypothetical protein
MPEAASVLIGPAEMALTRMPLRPRSAAVAHARFQRRLRHAHHHIVVRHDLLGAVIGERQHRAARDHELLGALGQRRERVAGNEHGLGEVLLRGVDVAAVELCLVGEGDGMHQEVELAPLPAELGKDLVHGGFVRDIAGEHQL